MYGYESSCPEGVDQNTALLATAAAIGNTGKYISKIYPLLAAVGAGVIYRAVTLQQAGRRRRRGAEELRGRGGESWARLQDLVMLGGCSLVDS